MKAPISLKSGKKIPKKNIQPCPFRSVLNPSVKSTIRYKKAPNPIPHHMVPPWIRVAVDSHLECDVGNEVPLRPIRMRPLALRTLCRRLGLSCRWDDAPDVANWDAGHRGASASARLRLLDARSVTRGRAGARSRNLSGRPPSF